MWSKRLFPHRNMQPPPSPLHPPLGVSLVSLCDLSHAQTNPLRVSGIEHADKGSGGPCAAVHSPVWPFHLSFTIPPSHKPRSRPCTHPAQPLQFALISLQEIHPPPPPPLAHLSSCHPALEAFHVKVHVAIAAAIAAATTTVPFASASDPYWPR